MSINVIISQPSPEKVYRGTNNELKVIVLNQTVEGLLIEVYLNLPSSIATWCKHTRFSFNLDSQKAQQILFTWEIPFQVPPAIYNYEIIVDSANYLKTPLRYSRQLEILIDTKSPDISQEPYFSLDPVTSSKSPLILESGESRNIKVTVYNNSKQVDQFRLTCDLDESWFTIYYPEKIKKQGLVNSGKNLDLLPGSQGEINLAIHPPVESFSGNYRPDITLYSTATPDLLLKKILYFQIQPTYLLQVDFYTILNQVKYKAGEYRLELTNKGNTLREIAIQVFSADEENYCDYEIEQPTVKLPPNKTANIKLKVKPKSNLKRSFLKIKQFNFKLDIQDLKQQPLPKNLPIQGTLLWLPRPWWQFLGLILAIFATLACLGFLIWQLIKPLPPLQIVSLETTTSLYRYNYGEPINLKWQIKNTKELKILILQGELNSHEKLEDQQFNFNPEKIPKECEISDDTLFCRNIFTGAVKPGSYIFTLIAIDQKNKQFEYASKEITILERPLTEVKDFQTDKNNYKVGENINLSFKIENHQDTKIVLKINDKVDEAFQLNCQSIDTYTQECNHIISPLPDGEYTLSLNLIYPEEGYQEPPEFEPLTTKILVQTPIKFVKFRINGQDVGPIIIKPREKPTVEWAIEGKDVKVSINYIARDLPAIGRETLSEFPTSGSFDISLKATDAYGQSIEPKILTIQIEPEVNNNPSLDEPNLLKNLK